MKPFTPEQKKIDHTLSPALVKGGKDARETLARILWKERRNKENPRFALNLAAFTGYPTRVRYRLTNAEGESVHKMKLLARDQWVGDGFGYCFKRDLWEDKNGNRISIRKGKGIWRN